VLAAGKPAIGSFRAEHEKGSQKNNRKLDDFSVLSRFAL